MKRSSLTPRTEQRRIRYFNCRESHPLTIRPDMKSWSRVSKEWHLPDLVSAPILQRRQHSECLDGIYIRHSHSQTTHLPLQVAVYVHIPCSMCCVGGFRWVLFLDVGFGGGWLFV